MNRSSFVNIAGLTGRLGNKILQHIDAFIYSKKNQIDAYCLDSECSTYIKKCSTKKLSPSLRRNWRLSEVIFDEKEIDLREYFVLKEELIENDEIKNTGAIHFRGTDFAKWKAHSITEPRFFLEALECFGSTVQRINVVTDDPNHFNLNEIVESLRKAGVQVSIFNGSQHSDFMRLLMSDWIIASPSTFSLSASILGGGKIVFPKKYAEIEAKAGADFWKACMKGAKSPYVEVEVF